MRIIPVLDILNGQVVHGIKGERNKYTPIQSKLTTSTNPLDVALAFKRLFPINELYIADLDAILHQNYTFPYLPEIIGQTNLSIMLDAGIDDLNAVQTLLQKDVGKVIIGTETLRSLSNLEVIITQVSPQKLIVSLDLKNGRILSKGNKLQLSSALEAIHLFEKFGIQELIILELTKVGSESGVMTPTLRKILQNTSIPIISGGGARNIQDLEVLKDAGVSGVLIATALHKGTITSQNLISI
jgi:phosphoribosylformimino-5-aminoimidazole carboxamide ribotide isomerase